MATLVVPNFTLPDKNNQQVLMDKTPLRELQYHRHQDDCIRRLSKVPHRPRPAKPSVATSTYNFTCLLGAPCLVWLTLGVGLSFISQHKCQQKDCKLGNYTLRCFNFTNGKMETTKFGEECSNLLEWSWSGNRDRKIIVTKHTLYKHGLANGLTVLDIQSLTYLTLPSLTGVLLVLGQCSLFLTTFLPVQ